MSTLDLQPRPTRDRDERRDPDLTGPPMSTASPRPRHAATPPPPPPAPNRRDRTPGRGRSSLVAAALVGAVAAAAVATPIALLVDDDATAANMTAAAGASSDSGVIGNVSDPGTNGTVIDVSAVAEAVSPSVVTINVSTPAGSGTGSGVVFDDDGNIVTNNHVVGDATTVGVTLPDGRQLDATVVGTDPTTDLAVVHVDDGDLVPLALASEPPAIGSAVVAIGSPFGLNGSVTSGIVSALNREVASSAIPLTGLVQTDAAINPGNSGGALVDASGELVGINTAIASSGGGSDGIGFAIDTPTVQSVATDLITDGVVQHSWLGVAGTTTVSSDGQPTGAQVEEVVSGSPAAAAGLQPGDHIVELDGEEIPSFPDLAARLVRLDPGTDVTLTVERDGSTQDLTVTLGEAT